MAGYCTYCGGLGRDDCPACHASGYRKPTRRYFTITRDHLTAKAPHDSGDGIASEAARARAAIGRLLQCDIGKRVYYGAGLAPQAESGEQRDARVAKAMRRAWRSLKSMES